MFTAAAVLLRIMLTWRGSDRVEVYFVYSYPRIYSVETQLPSRWSRNNAPCMLNVDRAKTFPRLFQALSGGDNSED